MNERKALVTPVTPSGYLIGALALLVLAPPALLGWVAGAVVLRSGWVSRGRLSAAGGVTGALALVVIGPAAAAGGLLATVAALAGILPATLTAGAVLEALSAVLLRGLGLAWVTVPAGVLAATLNPAAGPPLTPEWTAQERRRRLRADQRAQRRARALAVRTSETNRETNNALAVSIGGDLPDDWRRGRYLVLPDRVAGLPQLVVGRPGQGKSVLLQRYAYLAGLAGRRATFVDCKGEPEFSEQVVAAYLAGRPDATVHVWPDTALNGWVGGPSAVANRLLACWEFDLAAQWYREIVSLGLRLALHAPGKPVASSAELVARMQPGALGRLWNGHRDEQELIRSLGNKLDDVAIRVANLMSSLGSTLDGEQPLGTADCTVLSLPVMAAEHDAAAILRVAMADLAHHVAVRKARGDRELIVVDEASAVAGGREHMIHLAERGRSANVATVMAVQSRRGLGDDDEADRLIGAAGLVVLFGTAEPEDILKLAGTVRQVELAAQVEDGELTGRSTATVRASHRVDANVVKALAPGQALLLSAGRAELCQVIRPPARPADPRPPQPASTLSLPLDRLRRRGVDPARGPRPGLAGQSGRETSAQGGGEAIEAP